MGAEHLKLVRTGDEGVCGAATADGSPCQRPAGANGRCWEPSHQDDARQAAEYADLPEPPEHLGDFGQACWKHHVRECHDLGVLDQVDVTVIEKAAEVYEVGKRAWKDVQKYGSSVQGRDGSRKTNPAIREHREYTKEYRQYAKELARLKASATPDNAPEEGPGKYL